MATRDATARSWQAWRATTADFLEHADFHEALQRGAGSDRALRAAVDLAIATGWTYGERGNHLGAHVHATSDPTTQTIGWRTVVDALERKALPATASELHVLRIAASLAGGGPVVLGAAVGELTPAHRRAVRRALRRATDADEVVVPKLPQDQAADDRLGGALFVYMFGALALLWLVQRTADPSVPIVNSPRVILVVAWGLVTLLLCDRMIAAALLARWSPRHAVGNLLFIGVMTLFVAGALVFITAPLARFGLIAGLPLAFAPPTVAAMFHLHGRCRRDSPTRA